MENLWDIDSLSIKIEEFKLKSFETEMVSEVVEQLSVFYDSFNLMISNFGNIPAFRVRKIEIGTTHNTRKCVWAPPKESVTRIGRVNDIGESIFYAAFDPLTAILEGRIQPGDDFSLSTYFLEPKEDWYMTSVVINVPKQEISQIKKQDEYAIMLSKFMVEEFTKEVKEGNEHQYKKCCAMAKILLSTPKKDSIIYPSIQNENRVNIAMIEEKAQERMHLKSVVKCKLLTLNESISADVEVQEIAQATQGSEEMIYQAIPKKNFKMLISHDTWVKDVMSFKDNFNIKNIATPEEILNSFLKKNNK